MAKKHFTSILNEAAPVPAAPAAATAPATAPAAAPAAAPAPPTGRRGKGRPPAIEAGAYHLNAKVKAANGATLQRIVDERIGGCRSIREALDHVIEVFASAHPK